jgi:hemerythrin superfamily protein
MDPSMTGGRADAIEFLTAQHRDVEQLWGQANAAKSTGDDSARDLGQRVITLLSQHDAIETQLLYPALRDVSVRGDQLADHSLEEHQHVRELLKAADGNLDDADGWSSLAEALRAVQRHVAEEEGDIFPMLRMTGQEELHDLGDALQAAMKLAPTHPHPSTPNNPIGATLVGGAAAIVDRVRDALRKAG